MTSIKLENIEKSFGSQLILDQINHTFMDGKITAVLGPSGCGKSTLLAIIAGLVKPDLGNLYWDNNLLNDIPSHLRDFGLMFQDYALFPHMNVFENIAFGLKMKNIPSSKIENRVSEVLGLVNLPHLENRNISTLSGGEAQRIALARTLAPNPKLLMLDEPLGALDRALRELLIKEFYSILRKYSLTTIYVTHDQEEAFNLADEIVLMQSGKIEQVGSPREIYLFPKNKFVAKFMGFQNLLPALGFGNHAQTDLGDLPLPGIAWGEITLLVRPEGIKLDHTGKVKWTGTLIEQKFLGDSCRAVLEIAGKQFIFSFPPRTCIPAENNQVLLSFEPNEVLQILPG